MGCLHSRAKHSHVMPREYPPRFEEAAIAIQRIYRTRDPITLAHIRHPFLLYRNGSFQSYDAESLLTYIQSSGCIEAPLDGVPLRRFELSRLQRKAGRRLPSMDDLEEVRRREVERGQIMSFLTNEILDAHLEDGDQDLLPILLDLRETACGSLEWEDSRRWLEINGVRCADQFLLE